MIVVEITTPGSGVPKKLPTASAPNPAGFTPVPPPDPHALTPAQREMVRDGVDFSILVYRDLAEVAALLEAKGFRDVRTFDRWDMQAVCFTSAENACIAFRGTVTAKDWLIDALAFPFFWPLRHFGFGLGWIALRKMVQAWVAKHRGDRPLFVCGHSLGGALAHLAAFDLARAGHPVGQVVTIGAPKFSFFLSRTAKRYNRQASNFGNQTLRRVTLNLVNKHDLVARVPPRWLGYCDVGRPIQNERDGTWRFTDRVESLLLDLLFESADLDDPAAQPWTMRRGPSGNLILPGLASTAVGGGDEFKRLRQQLYRLYPPLRLPVAYLLSVRFTLNAGFDHPSSLYRAGLFEPGEPERYPVPAKDEPGSTLAKKIALFLGLVTAVLILATPLYFIVRFIIELAARGQAP